MIEWRPSSLRFEAPLERRRRERRVRAAAAGTRLMFLPFITTKLTFFGG